jgi:hypothetical protein
MAANEPGAPFADQAPLTDEQRPYDTDGNGELDPNERASYNNGAGSTADPGAPGPKVPLP